MTTTIEAYALAANKGRHLLHVTRNGSSRAMCGARNVVALVDVIDIDVIIEWPYCDRCRSACGAIDDDGWWWSPGGLT